MIFVKDELKLKKIWQDLDGQMLAVEVNLEQQQKMLVGLYVQNRAKDKVCCCCCFDLQNRLNEERYDNIMLMGDFNAVNDTKVDKTSKKRGGKLPKSFFDLVKQDQLDDIWRIKNRDVKNYTFFPG